MNHKSGSPMRDQLNLVTETIKEDVKQVMLMKMYTCDRENFLKERDVVRNAEISFSRDLREAMSETLDETSKEVDTLIIKFHSLVHNLVKGESKVCRETSSNSLSESLDTVRGAFSMKTERELSSTGERLRSRKKRNIELERAHTIKMNKLYESLSETFRVSVEKNASKLKELYDAETASIYIRGTSDLERKREEYRKHEHTARVKTLQDSEKRHIESVRLAEQRVLVVIRDIEKNARAQEETIVISHFSRLLDQVIREKREDILIEESAYYKYLICVSSTTQCVSVMKKCDSILERLFAHVRKSVLAELESNDCAEIARLRQTCEEYVHTQLGNIPMDLVQSEQNLASHAKVYSNRMISKLTGIVEEVRDAFEDRARRLGLVYGASAEKLFRSQLETRTEEELRVWTSKRLDNMSKLAVQHNEKYVRHAINVVRRRISKHVREFRQRSEEVGRVLYMRQALCSLHSDFEKLQKCVLRDEASGERKEVSSVIKESSETGRMCAIEMCKLVRDTQRSIVEETATDEDVKILREKRKVEFQNKEIDMRKSMNRCAGNIIATIRRNRKEILKKHRSRVAELRLRYTKEAERVQVLYDESTAKKYAAMAHKSIEALLDWTKRRENSVASADERRVREIMTKSFDHVLETMRTELKAFESKCRADVKIMYDAQITRFEKINTGTVQRRFLEDAVSFYKYLAATEAEAEKHESVQVASMSKHSEMLIHVVTDFLSKNIRAETHVTEESELKRIRSVREQKIERCFEEFRATVKSAIDANQSLEQQADSYATQIVSDHKKRMKSLYQNSKRTYERLHHIFGITFARQHLQRQQENLEKLTKWSKIHTLELRRGATSRAQNIQNIARAIEESTRAQISNIKTRFSLESRREHEARLRSQHVRMIRDVGHFLLLAEKHSMGMISKALSSHSSALTRHKERVVEDLTRMVQASVLEETKVNSRVDLELIRKRRVDAIEDALTAIDREMDSKRIRIEKSVNAHAHSISQEAEYRIEKMKVLRKREIEVLRMLYGNDVAIEFETNSKLREDFELRERFEGERQILNFLSNFLATGNCNAR